MPGNRRRALIAWAVFAFITWNVVFDRNVYVASVHFTQQQVEKFQVGEPVGSIESAFRPEVRQAASRASAWAGAVLALGFLLTTFANRRGRKP